MVGCVGQAESSHVCEFLSYCSHGGDTYGQCMVDMPNTSDRSLSRSGQLVPSVDPSVTRIERIPIRNRIVKPGEIQLARLGRTDKSGAEPFKLIARVDTPCNPRNFR